MMKFIKMEGKIYTTDDLMNILGCSRSTAKGRIKNCKTLDSLLCDVIVNKQRVFKIEGKVFSVGDVVEQVGCSKPAAYGRLQRATTIEQLMRVSYNGSKNPHNKKMTDMDNPINKLLYGKW